MKTLDMMIEARKTGLTYRSDSLYYSEELGFVDDKGDEWTGRAFETLNQLFHKDGYDSDGWKVVNKLSDDEKAILRSLNKDFKYIARDRDGSLYIFTGKPTKTRELWNDEECDSEYLNLFEHLFNIIKWEDEEPTRISELLSR